MVNKIKGFVKYKYENYLINKEYKGYRGRKFILIGTPNHKNIGDQAIAYAEYKFLKENFNDYGIIDVNMEDYYRNKDILLKYINNDDIIFLHGGGNLGNEYLVDENIRRDVIKTFKENKIILFPQTIYFTKDSKGKDELEKSKYIYSQNNKLVLIARENNSFEIMKSEFSNNKVILVPDIVMYLNNIVKDEKRSGVLLCLRDDIEGTLGEKEHKAIYNMVLSEYDDVKITDMKADRCVKGIERKGLVISKLKEFKMHKLVITDRLHGMVFAAITGTPCIALSNYNYKVKGTYEWIKNLGYIKFTNNINDIPKLIEEVKGIGDVKYDNSFSVKECQQILEVINS